MTTLSLTALLTLAPGAIAGARLPEAKEIGQMAADARTPADHKQVAKSYVAYAKYMEERADKLDREVQAAKSGPKSAMETKWPAMVVNARERKVRLAMQARRAAEESRRLAAHHSKLAGHSLDEIAALE
jgi:hypothetical protein